MPTGYVASNVTGMVDHGCTVYGIIAPVAGRPPIQQHAVLDHLRDERRSVLDLKQDRPWLVEITPDPESLIRNMRKRGVLHTLQRGRYVVNLDNVSTALPRVVSMEQVAALVLRRLPHLDHYVSWHGALWHHGLIDQQSSVIRVAMREHRKRNVDVSGYEVRFVSVTDRHFFGAEEASTPAGAAERRDRRAGDHRRLCPSAVHGATSGHCRCHA